MERDLRAAMRNFATGVCIATTYVDQDGGRRHDAVTINSLTSLSLDPPLVSLCLGQTSTFLADLLVSKVWAVSILDAGCDDIARCFAKDRPSRASALHTLSASPGRHTGALVLDAPGWLECRLRRLVDVGDHKMAIGDVLAAGSQRRRPPLIFLHGRFHVVEDQPFTAPAPPRTVPPAVTDLRAVPARASLGGAGPQGR